MQLAREGIYPQPSSPYRPLLAMAGREYGDLEHMVRRDGVESTLATLLRHGVYLTVDEFKGRPLAPNAVAETFRSAIGAGRGAEKVTGLAWRDSGLLRVERRVPLVTASGKILHLHAGEATPARRSEGASPQALRI